MATRINTKFVITLASILIILVLGMAIAFTFLKKSAEDHVELADAAMERADAALNEGDVEVHNSERLRAAKHYGTAKAKEPSSTEYLYGYVKANQLFICKNLTSASNQLDSILSGAASIHDTLGASDEDREFLYELLYERARMGMFTNRQNPIGTIAGYTTRRLDAFPEDPIALKYQAMSLSYLVESKTNEAEIEQDAEAISAAVQANPDVPWLRSAMARYHVGNARRQYRTQGNTFSPTVNASFGLALEHVGQAIELSKGNPPAYLEAAGIVFDIRSNDEAAIAEISALKNQVANELHTMLQSKENRDKLFVEELDRAVAIMRQTRSGTLEQADAFDGPALAYELAQTVVKDRPDSPIAYQILGELQREAMRFDEAEKTIEAGLAVERLANAREFFRDHQARLNMKSALADIKTTLALQTSETEQREKLLKDASAMINELAVADTTQPEWREARVAFLRGRIALAQNNPRQAITLLEKANQAYNSKDAQTLRLLAQTHSRLGNDKLVAGFYETIATTLRPTAEDLLNLINLYLAPGEGQQLDKAQAQLEWYRKQVPGDIRGVRLEAQLLKERGKTKEAIALLQAQDLEKNPGLLELVALLQAQSGDTDGVIQILRDRLAAQPDGEPMNTQLVSQLLNLLPDQQAKLDELDRLVTQGLKVEVADVLRRLLTTGRATMEDELALIDMQDISPAQVALRKFQTYRRWNQPDAAKPFLDQAIALEPKTPEIIEWRFRIALSEQRWSDAQQALNDMLSLDPTERTAIAVADGRFMRAQLLAVQAAAMDEGEAQNKKFREAIVAYNNALSQYSHFVDGWIQLGRLHYAQQNYFAAQDSLLEALNRQSRNVEALELMALSEVGSGDQINAMERFEQILTIQPNHPTALDQFTALAQQMGITSRAIALREQIRDANPSNFGNRRVLALLYAQSNTFDKAKSAIQALITDEGNTRQNIATLSQIFGMAGSHDQAIEAMKGYLTALGDKASWRDHLLLAQTYEQAEQPEQADLAFAKSIEVEKAEGTFLSSLAFAQTMLNRGKTAQAAELFEDLIKQYPDNQALKQQTAELYLRLQNYEKSQAIANDLPASVEKFRLLIQMASAQQGKLGVAIGHAREGVKAYPSDFMLRLNLLELLRAQQDLQAQDKRDYSKVLTMAKGLASDHPDRVEAMVALADVLLRMDRRAQAVAELEKALAFAPRHLATNERLFGIKLQEARDLASSNRDASQSKAQEALAIITLLIESRPNVPLLLRSAGQAAELAGFSAQAAEYYRQTFESSQTTEDLSAYASMLLQAGRGADARAVIEAPANATLVSNSLFLRALRGRAIAAAGQPDVAATLFGNLLGQHKEPAEQMMIVRQVTATYNSEPMRAIQIIEGSLGKDLPTSIDVTLASLLISQRQYEPAAQRLVKYVAEPIDDVPTQFVILMQLALAQQESGQLTQAKATYELVYEKMNQHKALIPDRQKVQMLNNMAYLLADQLQGYEDEAVGYAQQALDLMSDNVADEEYALIQDTLGWALFKAGRTQDAIRVLKESVAKFPLIANQLHLGQAYLAAGDKDRALLVLESAMNLAKTQKDEKMIAETQKWYRQAL